MKRVLIITYYWPPTGGSGVQRWVKFCKYLPSEGWTPVVYTPENPEMLAVDRSLLDDVSAELEVLRTHISEPYAAYRKLAGGKSEVNPINSQKKSFLKKLALLARGNLFVPDPRRSWVRPSVRFLKEYLEEHPVDAIVTTGPPHSMHLIGLKLRRSLKKDGKPVPKWFADFRDPWTKMFYFKHLGLLPAVERLHKRLEKQVLDEADGIISVTPLVKKDFEQMTGTPVHLLTNGYDERDFAGAVDPDRERFTLVHTGLFASDGNPEVLWDALKSKCDSDSAFAGKLEIRLAGKVDAEIIRSLEERALPFTCLGYLEHHRSVEELRKAAIVLLPLREDPEYRKVLPGKIFECLASRRPVLGVGQKDGAAAMLLDSCAAGKMFEWDDAEGVREFIDVNWKSFPDIAGGTSEIEKYSRANLTKSLTKILE